MAENFNRIMEGLGDVLEIVEGRAAPESYRVHVPEKVDVKAIRDRLKLTQAGFAERFGFSIGAVRDWEQDRRLAIDDGQQGAGRSRPIPDPFAAQPGSCSVQHGLSPGPAAFHQRARGEASSPVAPRPMVQPPPSLTAR